MQAGTHVWRAGAAPWGTLFFPTATASSLFCPTVSSSVCSSKLPGAHGIGTWTERKSLYSRPARGRGKKPTTNNYDTEITGG